MDMNPSADALFPDCACADDVDSPNTFLLTGFSRRSSDEVSMAVETMVKTYGPDGEEEPEWEKGSFFSFKSWFNYITTNCGHMFGSPMDSDGRALKRSKWSDTPVFHHAVVIPHLATIHMYLQQKGLVRDLVPHVMEYAMGPEDYHAAYTLVLLKGTVSYATRGRPRLVITTLSAYNPRVKFGPVFRQFCEAMKDAWPSNAIHEVALGCYTGLNSPMQRHCQDVLFQETKAHEWSQVICAECGRAHFLLSRK
jgi:hypothetical protein